MDKTKSTDEHEFNCLICKENIKYVSIGECNHSEVCLYCTLKLRMLYNDFKCSVCKNKNSKVVIYEYEKDQTTAFADLNLSDCYNMKELEEFGIYCLDVSSMEEASNLLVNKCPINYCNDSSVFENFKSLNNHVNKIHKRFYCEVCVKDGKRFISEASIFTSNDLNNHFNHGEYDEYWNLLIPIHPHCMVRNLIYLVLQ